MSDIEMRPSPPTQEGVERNGDNQSISESEGRSTRKYQKEEKEKKRPRSHEPEDKRANTTGKENKRASPSLWKNGTTVIHPTHTYMRIKVEQYTATSKQTQPTFIPLAYSLIAPAISSALTRMFGNFGAGRVRYSFVNKQCDDGVIVLHVPVDNDNHKKLWAAITSFSTLHSNEDVVVRFTVTHSSPFLIALGE